MSEHQPDPIEHLDFREDGSVSKYHGITIAAAARMEIEAACINAAAAAKGIKDDHAMLADLVDNHLMPVVEKWAGICFGIGVHTGLSGEVPGAIRAEDVDPNHPDVDHD